MEGYEHQNPPCILANLNVLKNVYVFCSIKKYYIEHKLINQQ